MDVEQVAVSELSGMVAPYNPRRISDYDLEALRRSLRFFGTVEPVVANRRSGRIVGGHQRVRAAEAEGLEALPVVWVDLDEPSEKQLNLALNRISGDWDDEKLREVMRGLEAESAELALTGFPDAELEQLLGEAVVDPLGEWVGMPAFESNDATGFRSIVVHLADAVAVEKFERALEIKLPEKARYIHYPKQANDVTRHLRYQSDAA